MHLPGSDDKKPDAMKDDAPAEADTSEATVSAEDAEKFKEAAKTKSNSTDPLPSDIEHSD